MGVDIIDDDFMVCTDCLMIIANDDASGLDYSLGEEEAEARELERCSAPATLRQLPVGMRYAERHPPIVPPPAWSRGCSAWAVRDWPSAQPRQLVPACGPARRAVGAA